MELDCSDLGTYQVLGWFQAHRNRAHSIQSLAPGEDRWASLCLKRYCRTRAGCARDLGCPPTIGTSRDKDRRSIVGGSMMSNYRAAMLLRHLVLGALADKSPRIEV